MAYAVTFRRHGRFKLNTSYLKSSVKCADGSHGDFFIHECSSLTYSIKSTFLRLTVPKITFHEPSKVFFLYTTKNTLIVMIHLFTRVFHEPRTLNIINKTYTFATYACTKEHFMSLLRFFR